MTDGLGPLGLADRARRAIRLGVLIPLADIVSLALLWVVASLFFGFILYGEETYFLGPWWAMAVVVVEGAALWGTLGLSPGMRLLGVGLPKGKGRIRYWAGWHLWPLSALTGLLSLQGLLPSEWLSGLRLVETKFVPRSWYRTSVGWAAVLVALFTLGAAVGVLQINVTRLVTGFPRTIKFWRAIATPDTALLGRGVQLLIETFFMALMATLFAIPVAAVLSFLAARNLMRGLVGRPAYFVVRMAASVTRSVDAVIWAIIFAVWVGVGAFAGALALWLHSIVDLLKLYSEQLENIDPGPVEAVTATGANRLQVIRYGIIPQIINPYISFTLYRWDINVRMATVVGLVGGGGIGFRLAEYLKAWAFAEATMLTILVVILVWAIDYLSARLRAKLA